MNRRSWKTLHRKLGLAVCLPVLLQGLTGVLLTLHEESGPKVQLDSKLEEFEVERDAPRLLKLLDQESANARPDVLFLPKTPSQALRLRSIQEQKTLDFYFHPQTLKAISFASETEARLDWEKWMLHLHRGSWWGPQGGLYGRILVSICALLWLALWASGLVMATKQKLNRSLAFRVHGGVGAILGVAFCWMASTGTLLNFSKYWLSTFDPPPRAQVEGGSPIGIAWSQLPLESWIHRSRQEKIRFQPEGNLAIRSLHFPKPPDAGFLVYFEDNSRSYFNIQTGAHLKTQTPETQWILKLFGLHTAQALGPIQVLFLLIVGNGVLLVTLLGVLLALKPRSALRTRN